MAQEYKNIGIIGAGASGCLCAYFLLKAGLDVTLFDYGTPLRTLLPTGGGRCNLAHAEYDFRELAKNYPRGEKFLYSVFSKFSTYDTIDLFKELGIDTYVQDDQRIFPVSNSSKEVREKMLNSIKPATFQKEKVIRITPSDNEVALKTDKAEYLFSDIIIATGGGNPIDGIKNKTVPFTPSLVGLNTKEKYPSGIVINNVYNKDCNLDGNLLFTHFGISGPLAFKISSVKTKDAFPYTLIFDLYPSEFDFQAELNLNPHKDIKNILSKHLPLNFVKLLLKDMAEIKAHKVDGKMRDTILENIHNFKLTITGTNKGEETVTAGGYDLDEINPKTMESKIHSHVYFTGEILDIDGFCGGFNLQNAWSTAFVAAQGIINQ